MFCCSITYLLYNSIIMIVVLHCLLDLKISIPLWYHSAIIGFLAMCWFSVLLLCMCVLHRPRGWRSGRTMPSLRRSWRTRAKNWCQRGKNRKIVGTTSCTGGRRRAKNSSGISWKCLERRASWSVFQCCYDDGGDNNDDDGDCDNNNCNGNNNNNYSLSLLLSFLSCHPYYPYDNDYNNTNHGSNR